MFLFIKISFGHGYVILANFLFSVIISFADVFLNDLNEVILGVAVLTVNSGEGVDFHEDFPFFLFLHSEFFFHIIFYSSKGHAYEQILDHWIDASFFIFKNIESFGLPHFAFPPFSDVIQVFGFFLLDYLVTFAAEILVHMFQLLELIQIEKQFIVIEVAVVIAENIHLHDLFSHLLFIDKPDPILDPGDFLFVDLGPLSGFLKQPYIVGELLLNVDP